MNDFRNFLPAWAVMWLLAAVIFGVCKVVVRRRVRPRPAGWRRVAWWLWPGMDARPWTRSEVARMPAAREWIFALAKTAAGICLLWGMARNATNTLVSGWIGMTGLILMLHCGLFHLLALFWRSRGIAVEPIMRSPLLADSLTDFWGRRWNRAFSDFATPVIFRPVARRFGTAAAGWAVFLFSGLVHEMVISFPARAGWGLPTAYFLLQGAGVAAERRWRFPPGTPLMRAWTVAVAAGPAFWLFHPPFVNGVMIPFFHAINAI